MYGREPGTFATMAFFLSFFFVSCQEHLPPRGERKKRFHVVFDCRCFCATGAPVCISHLDDRCYWNPALALPLGQVSFSLLFLLRKKNESWRFFCGSGTCARKPVFCWPRLPVKSLFVTGGFRYRRYGLNIVSCSLARFPSCSPHD